MADIANHLSAQNPQEDIPEWLKTGYPSQILEEIRQDARLLDACNGVKRWDHCPGSVGRALIDRIKPEHKEAIFERMVFRMLDGAFDYEVKRIRKQMKSGGVVRTDFPGLLVNEIAWAAHHGDSLGSNGDELLANLSAADADEVADLINIWKMPNGESLGSSTAGYLRKAASDERAMAEGHLRNAIFYEMIARGLPDNAIIGVCVKAPAVRTARWLAFEAAHPGGSSALEASQ